MVTPVPCGLPLLLLEHSGTYFLLVAFMKLGAAALLQDGSEGTCLHLHEGPLSRQCSATCSDKPPAPLSRHCSAQQARSACQKSHPGGHTHRAAAHLGVTHGHDSPAFTFSSTHLSTEAQPPTHAVAHSTGLLHMWT